MSYTTINAKNNVFEQGAHYMTSPYGMRDGRMHNGIDLIGKAYAGDNIVAFADGKVIAMLNTCNGATPAEGNHVVIDHGNGAVTYYYHIRKGSVTVNVGDNVTKGQVIGYMGTTGDSTGPHLHFGIKINGGYVDPRPYLEGASQLIVKPAPVPAPVLQPPQEDYIAYKVQKNDSFWGIAQAKLGNGNRYMEIVNFNGMKKDTVIHPGQILKIPCGQAQAVPQVKTYTVQPGDSFWGIAQAQMGNGNRYNELAAFNGLQSTAVIHPGQTLKIPN